MKRVGIIGAGAAGIFAAISIKEKHPNYSVTVFEKQADILQKVKISGGGRCNVTHACFDFKELVDYYPRGGKGLLSLFSQFQPGDTMDWFESRGVELKIESDGRVFPKSDSSQTIIDCLLNSAIANNVAILTKRQLVEITKKESNFDLVFSNGEAFSCEKLIFTTGSSRKGHAFIKSLGHSIVDPVASLFTFTVKDKALTSLAGLSIKHVEVTVKENSIPKQSGPLLITHWGLSGPAIIKTSAWGALVLNKLGYKFDISINLLPNYSINTISDQLHHIIANNRNKKCVSISPFSEFPLRFWLYICDQLKIDGLLWKQLNTAQLDEIIKLLMAFNLKVSGKSNFKDEFVTAGGVDLNEVNLKTMESKYCSGLFFAGEVLNIDGVTGGFNFQNAWTTAKQVKIN